MPQLTKESDRKKLIAAQNSDDNAESDEYQEINDNDLESFEKKQNKPVKLKNTQQSSRIQEKQAR